MARSWGSPACMKRRSPTGPGRITAIAVLPDTRGTGAGRALVEAAEAHFVAKGIARLEVTSGENHAAAHPFYRHLGYTDQGIRFAKSLRGTDQ
jgi:ribosomal protein S18 acetylase RimI-like enzyme